MGPGASSGTRPQTLNNEKIKFGGYKWSLSANCLRLRPLFHNTELQQVPTQHLPPRAQPTAADMLRGLSQSDLRIDLSVDKLTKSFYSTLDKISGRVVYAPQLPVAVNDVIIDFLGLATTWVDPLTPGAPRRKEVLEVSLTARIC